MRRKTLQLTFLVLAGIIVGWREWNSFSSPVADTFQEESSVSESKNLFIEMTGHYQDMGSASELILISGLALSGLLLIVLLNGIELNRPKLSSPNSV